MVYFGRPSLQQRTEKKTESDRQGGRQGGVVPSLGDASPPAASGAVYLHGLGAMARKPRVPKEKREPAHKMDGDGLELIDGDRAESAESEWPKNRRQAVFNVLKLLRHDVVHAYQSCIGRRRLSSVEGAEWGA